MIDIFKLLISIYKGIDTKRYRYQNHIDNTVHRLETKVKAMFEILGYLLHAMR